MAWRERPNLAEFGVSGDSHCPVNTPCDRGIVVSIQQALGGGLNCCHGPGARGICGEVGSAEIECVGYPSTDHVGELTGHGVFCDGVEVRFVVLLEGIKDALLLNRGQPFEPIGFLERLFHLGVVDPNDGFVAHAFSAHGVSENDCNPREIGGSTGGDSCVF